MRFNCFLQLGGPEAHELKNSIMGAFYARYPEVQKAINYDAACFGELTEKTRVLLRLALDQDAGMHEALDATRKYLNVFDRCGGSEDVSPDEFAAVRAGLRAVVRIVGSGA